MASIAKATTRPALRSCAQVIRKPTSQRWITSATAAVQDYEIPLEPLPPSRRLEKIRDAKPFSAFLTDTYQRQHDYLRISLTEKCNLRCVYCMPEEGVPQSPPAELLTTPEIFMLSQLFVSEGVTKIRLTGGEPTVRKDILPLMHQIGSLRSQGLRELCLTTNGIALWRKLDSMAEAGLTAVNLSLDTLDPWQFQIMTRRKGFEAVMKSINRILEMNKTGAGIKLKINCVVMRGVNEREILPFVEMGREQDIEVRFIEYMPFDGNKWSKGKMLSFQEMVEMIKAKYPTLRRVTGHKNDTSKTYEIPGFVGKIGFITSMTHNFCGSCNRLRITSDGNLKVCLFGNAEVSLRDIIRKSNDGNPIDEEAFEAIKQVEMDRQQNRIVGGLGRTAHERELLDVIGLAVSNKKEKHAGMENLKDMKNRPMILIDDNTARNQPQLSSESKFRPRTQTNDRWSQIPYHLLPSSPSQIFMRQHSTSTSKSQATISPKLTHLTTNSQVHMVPISHKDATTRKAVALCTLHFSNSVALPLIRSNSLKKGDVLAVARIAGIMAAKKCSDLIPLCHPIAISSVEIDVVPIGGAEAERENTAEVQSVKWAGTGQGDAYKWQAGNLKDAQVDFGRVEIKATVVCDGKTGVEMEALTAASVAALTVYDMCKAVDKGMRIEGLRVVRKEGGKSGTWIEGESVTQQDTS